MQPSLSFAIVGPGRLGSSLAAALYTTGYPIAAVAGRGTAAAQALAARLGDPPPATVTAGEAAARADVVVLAVQDSAVAAVAREIPWRAANIAVHCSGALGLDVLDAAAAAGASTGCFHPLQSFPSRTPDPSRFTGITCGVEGDPRAVSLLLDVAARLGSRAVRLEGVDRALYHAAAVFAANDAVALMSFAARAWTLAGLPLEAARPALAPLLAGAAANIVAADLPQALTGPVARGDVATVERHLAALAADPALLESYRRLGAELLRVAAIADPLARERLQELLTGP